MFALAHWHASCFQSLSQEVINAVDSWDLQGANDLVDRPVNGISH
jgi:hypothetical protein